MFRFSIRELILLTLVVALAVTAGLTQLDRQRLAKENEGLRNDSKKSEETHILRRLEAMDRMNASEYK